MREVKREAKLGEYIKLVDAQYTFDKNGDILKIDGVNGLPYVLGKNHKRETDFADEYWSYPKFTYVVLEDYEEEKVMKKSDLKNGTIVELRDERKMIVLLDCDEYMGYKDLLINISNGNYIALDDYDENLKEKYGCVDLDIMKVCQKEYVGDNIRAHIINAEDEWTWIRKEETVMTISEIEEKLGITGLKIKKED